MFQFPGFASRTYEFSAGYRRSGGLPHSEIHGSKPARGSPWLIATCCVLHRLSVPRHPPDALQTLDLIGAYLERRSDDGSPLTNAPRAGESPQGTNHQPATHPAKMHHHDPTDCLPTAEATALSGHPRSLILFTCQRSHTRSRADICFLSHGYRSCRVMVTEGHCPSLFPSSWWRRTGSNRRPHACKARALPTELRPHGEGSGGTVVGQGRLELPTSRLSSARSNQLSY